MQPAIKLDWQTIMWVLYDHAVNHVSQRKTLERLLQLHLTEVEAEELIHDQMREG